MLYMCYSPYTHAQLIHCTYSKAHAYRMQAKYASSTYVNTAVAKGHRKDYLTHTSPLNYVRMSSPCRYVTCQNEVKVQSHNHTYVIITTKTSVCAKSIQYVQVFCPKWQYIYFPHIDLMSCVF